MPDLLERLGTALADRYAVESEIGRGGMATVFLAEDLKHHRKVAIKVMHPELASAVGGERFLREVEIAAGLDHPHILTLLDSGEADGLLYYVMPYVEGESLRFRLEREGQLPIEEAVRIAREVGDGLAYAHRHGVIHRDIKPANIMLSEGHALVADFGVARAVGGEGQALTSTGLAVGTPAYMSPEQASSGKVDARSDLYALGCVLYEMLAGLPPLTGPTPQATAAMRLTETATPLPVVRDTVPGGLERLTQKLLTKSPADRYGAAEKLIEALDDPGLWAEAKPRRRVWKRVGSVAVALALLAFGIFATQWLAGRGRNGGVEVVQQRVAVLTFENQTDDPALDYLGKLAAERITSRLQREDVGEIVPRRSVASVVQGAELHDPIVAVSAETGASIVVDGVISRIGDSLRFDVRLTDPVTGTLEGVFFHSSPSDGVPDPALEEVGSRLAGGLLLAFWGEQPDQAMKVFPKVDAYRALREGVEYQVDGMLEQALDRFYAARTLDTTFVVPLQWAIATTSSMGDQETADSLLALVDSVLAGTPGSEISRYAQASERAEREGDLEAAYLYAQNAAAASQDLSVELNLAYFCLATNRPNEALETLETLGSMEGPLLDEPLGQGLYLVQLAHAYHMLGEYEAELDAARAHERLELGGLGPLTSMYLVARAAAALGQAHQVHRVLDQLEAQVEPTSLTVMVMVAAALELRYQGLQEDAEMAMHRITRGLEERPGWMAEGAGRQLAYGRALYYSESWEEAYAVLAPLEERPDPFFWKDLLPGYLGLLAARRGNAESANTYSAQLETIETDNSEMQAGLTSYRGRIAAVLGRKQEAVSYLKRAFDEGLKYQPRAYPWSRYGFDFEGMADYAPYQELLRPKG